jgi:hypothetical protein
VYLAFILHAYALHAHFCLVCVLLLNLRQKLGPEDFIYPSQFEAKLGPGFYVCVCVCERET